MSFEKIQIENSKLPHARFDLSKEHYTTFQWGEVSPILVRTIDTPDQKISFTSNKLARLNPLISPTYGKIKIKEYYQFVPWKSIFRGCNSFLAQVERRANYDKLMSRVDRLPRIETCVFMYLLTRGGYSHSWMWGRNGSDVTTNSWTLMTTNYDKVWNGIFPTMSTTYTNLDPTQYSGCENQNGVTWANSQWQIDPQTADYVCCAHNSTMNIDMKFAMKLTQKGLRLQKLILGCGLPLSFQSDYNFSILHLLSVYRAYFDIFQIKQYWNWEQTAAYELIKYYDTNVSSAWDINLQTLNSNSDLNGIFFRFIDELVDMYYTANVDNISSQLPLDWNLNATELQKLSGMVELDGIVSANQNNPIGGGNPTVGYQTLAYPSDGGNALNPAGNLPTNTLDTQYFSQFTDEFIKKCYYYCNKKTQLGYDIANLLKAKGLGGYVDLLDSGFVGKCETSLTISEVISTADTNLRQLGDYAGQSSRLCGSDRMYLHNNEIGVLVGLAVVVPESHLSNCPDMSQAYTTPQEWYNPILDGLGYEGLSRMAIGHDDAQFHQRSGTLLKGTFGLQPRYQSSKVANDTRAGMFALRSVRDSYNPFHLARLITTHESEVVHSLPLSSSGSFVDNTEVLETTQIETFPNAGEVWRFPAKYEFMGHYNRIFYDDPGVSQDWFVHQMDERYPVDGFMAFFKWQMNCSAPKLPTSKTFETICEETEDNHTWTATK